MQFSSLRLVQATREHLVALDDNTFERRFGWPVPTGWPEFPEAMTNLLAAFDSPDPPGRWAMYFFVDDDVRALVGSGGFHGPPSDGAVEIGYEVAPEFRGRGYATRAAWSMVQHADEAGVERVVAHTLAEQSPSTGVLTALGFARTGELVDPDVGEVWEWELRLTDR